MRLVKAVLLLSSAMTVMAGAVISPALPEISRHFSGDSVNVLTKLVLTMPALTIALCAPLAGHLSDLFGRRKLLVFSLFLYGLSGSSGFFLNDLFLLLVSRAVLGISVGGIMSAATALIGDLYSGNERAEFIGLQSGFMYIGGIVLILLGGFLAEISWKAPFLAYLSAFAVFIMAIIGLRDPNSDSNNSGMIDREEPLLMPYLVVGLIYLLVFLLMVFYYMVLVQLPFILQNRFGIGSAVTGLAISVAAFAGAVSSLSFPLLKRRLSYRSIYVLGFGFVAAGYVLIGNFFGFTYILAGLALAGFGNGMLMPNGSFWLMEVTPEQIRGKAVGGFTGMIFLGQFLSPILMAPVVSLFSLDGAFLASAVFLLAVAIFLTVLPMNYIVTPPISRK
ncbi:MFS transporter [Prosthecochloris sp.]|uniref:MFS transporter n=1 Tax=Prosthecochloris sp. TaxID=290513 RepID=UPI0025EC364A|nr:MFS transporter [Prosthecochloris sp.]